MSSFGAVARVRRLLSEREGHKVKVGHTGTLDPFATGLLILLAGKATKKAPELTKLDKVYEATIRLGATSSTGDPEGEITITDKKPEISREKIIETLAQFVGEIE
jgi:tRNA pseudouridine55 synthase